MIFEGKPIVNSATAVAATVDYRFREAGPTATLGTCRIIPRIPWLFTRKFRVMLATGGFPPQTGRDSPIGTGYPLKCLAGFEPYDNHFEKPANRWIVAGAGSC